MKREPAITIRRVEPRDAEALKAIFDSPRSMAGTLQLPYPSVAMWAKRIADFPIEDVMLVAEVGDDLVGNLGLHVAAKSPRRRHAGAIGMSVRDDWQNRGVGTALLAAGIDLADNWIGFTRLELTVFTDNAPALALYRKFGFVIEGTARGYALRDGQLADVFMMARHVRADLRRDDGHRGATTARKPAPRVHR